MPSYCLETRALTHRFSPSDIVLHNIDIQVEQGSIYGFLGPNGAGKTTTLRLILGLLKKQQGEVSVFGEPFDGNRVSILKKIGSLIESPSLYGHLTAHENLELWRKLHQCPQERIAYVLGLVGLANTGSKKASRFSLGMRQRLGIAVALLHNPDLLILDEPTNGLDPNGMIEMRGLLQTLNREHGITIVISSHLLSEIEKMVTHVGIIHKGNMLFQGTLSHLRDKQQQSGYYLVDTSNVEETMRIAIECNAHPERRDDKVFIPTTSRETMAMINENLVKHGVRVYEMSAVKSDLEAIFMDYVNS